MDAGKAARVAVDQGGGAVKRFWLVWNPRGENPSHRHQRLKSAKDEAERLARLHGGEFFVLEGIGLAKRLPDVIWEETAHVNEEEIPF